MVKITGDVEKTEIETVDAEKTVIFKGETVKVVDFVDATVGLSRMQDTLARLFTISRF